MKHVSGIVCCTVLTGLLAGPLAAAQPISVQITGHVTQSQDNTGLINNHLQISQPVTAIYTYDTSGPAIPDPMPPEFALSAATTSIVVSAGDLNFQTGPSSRIEAIIQPGNEFALYGYQNPPLSNGVAVDYIAVIFNDQSGQWPTSTLLPTGAPALSSLAYSTITVQGPQTTTGYFSIQIQIDSVQLLPPAIQVSPPAGNFLPQQHFDASVLLPLGGAALATMQASVGGTALALNYPGTCQLGAPTSSGRPWLLCPGADAALTSLQGITQIDWLVTLSDGSSYTQSVQWNLIH